MQPTEAIPSVNQTPDDVRLRAVHHVNQPVQVKMPTQLAEWEARAAWLRRHILISAGLWPLPERCALAAERFDPIPGDGFTIFKVWFQTLRGFWATGNLFVPEGTGPFPAVLNPHGHWSHGRLENSELGSVPARGVAFARMGAIALTLDMVGYNDSQQVEHRFGGPSEKLWGIGPLRLQLWNLIRAVDFLQQLPEVDPNRIGCTGASGGGTQTFLLTAVDPRIRVAAPVNMISAHMHGGCACENTPLLRIGPNNVEFGALAAPRPLLLVSATGDWTVNTPRVEYPAIRQVYDLYGAATQIETVQVDAPHNYNAESRRHVYRFFARWLLEKPDIDVDRLEVPLPSPVERLRILPGHPRPAIYLDQAGLIEQLKAEHRLQTAVPADAAGLASYRETWGAQLRHLLELDGARERSDVRCRVEGEGEQGGVAFRRLTIGTAAGGEAIPTLLLWQVADGPRRGGPLGAWPETGQTPVLAVHERGAAALWEGSRPGPLLQALLDRGRAVLTIDPFLTDAYRSPVGQAGRNTAVTHFETYNRTDAAWRVHDIALAARVLRQAAGRPVPLLGLGSAGLWGLLAMAATDHIGAACLDVCDCEGNEQGFLRHAYLPHLLRIGGLRPALAMAAPRPLALFRAPGALAAEASAIYGAAGDGERVATSPETWDPEQIGSFLWERQH